MAELLLCAGLVMVDGDVNTEAASTLRTPLLRKCYVLVRIYKIYDV